MALRLGSTPNTAALPRAWARPTAALQVAAVGCDALVDAEPQALGVTYWFDAASHGEPYAVTVHFTGHRLGVSGKPGPRDSFTQLETVEGVVPGSGRVAVTTRIFDIAPGEWHGAASVITPANPTTATSPTGRLSPAAVSASGATGFGPVIRVRAPGARLGTWPGLVGAGVAVALIVQSRLAARGHLPVMATLLVSLLASVVGLLGARIYYLAEQRPGALIKPRALLTAGMCIQGFVLAAIATASTGMLLAGVPIGRFLGVTAPGLLFGMSIGRFGSCSRPTPPARRPASAPVASPNGGPSQPPRHPRSAPGWPPTDSELQPEPTATNRSPTPAIPSTTSPATPSPKSPPVRD